MHTNMQSIHTDAIRHQNTHIQHLHVHTFDIMSYRCHADDDMCVALYQYGHVTIRHEFNTPRLQ